MNANPVFAASVAPARSYDRRGLSVRSLQSFDVYRVAIEAARLCVPISLSLNVNLRDQLTRASSSVVLNIAEGFGSSSRGVKRRHYEIAQGSATECIAILELADALGSGGEFSACVGDLYNRTAAMLTKLRSRFR